MPRILAERGREDDICIEAEHLETLVSTALRGVRLSHETLQIFINAFGIGDEHAKALQRQWEGADLARVVKGNLSSLDDASAIHPLPYRTISLHEFHYIGAYGQPHTIAPCAI